MALWHLDLFELNKNWLIPVKNGLLNSSGVAEKFFIDKSIIIPWLFYIISNFLIGWSFMQRGIWNIY
jgi:hypothetical protein